jgi:hypothetical protein
MRRVGGAGAALLLVACTAATAGATVLVGLDLGQVTRAARVVVRGRVVATTGRWTADHQTIETLVTLEAETYLKGALGETVLFAVPGGRLGRYRNIVVGAPTFAVGERVVVFLDMRGPSVPFLVGFSQGVYRIAASSDGAGPVVASAVVLPARTPTRVARGDRARRPMAVEAFDALVRDLVEDQP